MPSNHPRPVSADTPLGERFVAALSYPLRGTALATCLILALCQCLTIIPSFIGTCFGLALWVVRWRYAATCLVHTANGFAEPPDVGIEENDAAGRWFTGVHMAVVLACVAALWLYPPMFWPLALLFALLLPAIDMSLAFDGSGVAAFNPVTWQAVIGRLGAAYAIPVAVNIVTGALVALPWLMKPGVSALLMQPLFAFGYTYLVIFNLHLMGVMIHRHHERFDMAPEAETLARERGLDDDDHLLHAVHEMAVLDRRTAIGMLVTRMQGRSAPAKLHQAYRELLHKEGLRDGLLEHGQIWIAALMAQGEPRRALGVTQECVEIEPGFVPDSLESATELAELAASAGMTRLSIKLCRGVLARWPRFVDGTRLGVLAAQQMAERLSQHTEAAVLLNRLAVAWPDHPQRDEWLQLAATLQRHAQPARAPTVD